MPRNLQTPFSTRQYMLSRDFEIYYYSNQDLTSVSSHAHDYYEFYIFLEGHMTLYIQNTSYRLQNGDMVLVPPHTPHRAVIHDAQVPYRRFVFWISTDYCNQLIQLSSDYGYLMQHVLLTKKYVHHYDPVAFQALQSKALRLIEELQTSRFGKQAKLAICVSDLVLHLNRSVYEMEHPAAGQIPKSLYQNLLDYIETHLTEPLSLDQLAGNFYVSKYYISHLFKENLGLSVHQYILKKRLSMCRDALLTNTTISDIYLLYGFKDYSSFFRAFKKAYGLSPKEYREIFQITAPESHHP